jgi:hypothetical protein
MFQGWILLLASICNHRDCNLLQSIMIQEDAAIKMQSFVTQWHAIFRVLLLITVACNLSCAAAHHSGMQSFVCCCSSQWHAIFRVLLLI